MQCITLALVLTRSHTSHLTHVHIAGGRSAPGQRGSASQHTHRHGDREANEMFKNNLRARTRTASAMALRAGRAAARQWPRKSLPRGSLPGRSSHAACTVLFLCEPSWCSLVLCDVSKQGGLAREARVGTSAFSGIRDTLARRHAIEPRLNRTLMVHSGRRDPRNRKHTRQHTHRHRDREACESLVTRRVVTIQPPPLAHAARDQSLGAAHIFFHPSTSFEAHRINTSLSHETGARCRA